MKLFVALMVFVIVTGLAAAGLLINRTYVRHNDLRVVETRVPETLVPKIQDRITPTPFPDVVLPAPAPREERHVDVVATREPDHPKGAPTTRKHRRARHHVSAEHRRIRAKLKREIAQPLKCPYLLCF